MIIKKTGALLLLFVFLLIPFGGKVFQDADAIDIIGIMDQMPMEADFSDTVKAFEKAFDLRMVSLGDSENYAIAYLDAPDLTLFGYPVVVSTHQNATWDHSLILFANDHEKMRCLSGGRGTFLTLPMDGLADREAYTKDALKIIDEIYSGFGSSFGKLTAGGVMVYHDDGSGMRELLLSLPLAGDGTVDMNEIKRLFQVYGDGRCSFILETENSWQLHFEIFNATDDLEILVGCLKAKNSFLEKIGYSAFAGPDGNSAEFVGHVHGGDLTPEPLVPMGMVTQPPRKSIAFDFEFIVSAVCKLWLPS